MNDAPQAVAPRLRRSAVWLLPAALMALILMREFGADPPARAVYCREDTTPAAQQVTMLSATWCRYCAKARNWLVAHGVSYCEYDIERSATGAARYAASRLGAIPQIFVADRVIVGFDEQELERTLAEHKLLPASGKEGR
ncbi:MAG TPA: glutaredoxin domain-containing protein [Gammaproteobacteria bacterium]|nr:glutaredoxin domain-containing protein [Gammaproteobacteria bacterium]